MWEKFELFYLKPLKIKSFPCREFFRFRGNRLDIRGFRGGGGGGGGGKETRECLEKNISVVFFNFQYEQLELENQFRIRFINVYYGFTIKNDIKLRIS